MRKNIEELRGDLRLVERNLVSAQAHLIALERLNTPSVQKNILRKREEVHYLLLRKQCLLEAIMRQT